MKLGWIVASAILLWSNLREAHALPIPTIPESLSPTPSPSTSTVTVPLPIMMEIVLAAEQNEMSIESTDEIIPGPATVQVPTAAQSDEAQHTASPLSIETPSSTPMPTMSVSMRSVQQRRVAIVMGWLAGGIAVLALASVVAMLLHTALQKGRGMGQGKKRRGVKNHEMDDDDDDDIEDQHHSSRQLQSTRTANHSSSSVQSLDIPPTYALAMNHPLQLIHPSLGPTSALHAETIIPPSSPRISTSAPPAYGLPHYADAVRAARHTSDSPPTS